jgi:sugar lactone lactonase YvrE
MATDQGVELLIDAQAALGEGALWDPSSGILYWVDIDGGLLHAYEPQRGTDQVFPLGEMVSAVVVRRKGGLMLALRHGLAHFSPASGRLEIVAQPDKDRPNNRFNDGKCDPAGRFWVGTMDLALTPEAASLYCLDIDGSMRRVLTGVTCSNGIVWTRDARTMYYIDTPTREIAAFDYSVTTGEVSNRRAAIRVPERLGYPDGMCIDADDKLWVAMWGGSAVTHWDPVTGELVAAYALPVSQVTSCAFGGANLDELYVTSARAHLSCRSLALEPYAGGLFRLKPGASGVPCPPYLG